MLHRQKTKLCIHSFSHIDLLPTLRCCFFCWGLCSILHAKQNTLVFQRNSFVCKFFCLCEQLIEKLEDKATEWWPLSTYSTPNVDSVLFFKNSKFVIQKIHDMLCMAYHSQKYMTEKRKKILSVTKSTDLMLRKM